MSSYIVNGLTVNVYESFPNTTSYTSETISPEHDKMRNFNWRPEGVKIDTIGIGTYGSFEAANKAFSAWRGTSAHFVVSDIKDEDDIFPIHQYVSPELRAWAFGVSPRVGNDIPTSPTKHSISLNDNAISVWLINSGSNTYPEGYLETVSNFVKGLQEKYSIPNINVVSFPEFRYVTQTKQYNIDVHWEMERIIVPMKELAHLGVGADIAEYPAPPVPAETIITYSNDGLRAQCVQSLFYTWGYVFDYDNYANNKPEHGIDGYFGKLSHSVLRQFIKRYDVGNFEDKDYLTYTSHTQYKLHELLQEKFQGKLNIQRCEEIPPNVPAITNDETTSDSHISSCFAYVEDLDPICSSSSYFKSEESAHDEL